jgi:hypothetical protein
MPRSAQSLFAALAAVLIVAGSFGAIVTVPVNSSQAMLAAPTLA